MTDRIGCHSPARAGSRLSLRAVWAALGLCFAGVALSVLPARTDTLAPAQIAETVFPNGLRLVVKEARATDLAAVQVWIRAGGFLEDENTAGTAHIIEHLVYKGSDTRGPGAIDAEIEGLGGLLEASTEKDWTRFGCTVNGRYVGKVLEVIGDALRQPQFRPADFDAEKPLILEEINQMRLNPEAVAAADLYDMAFQEHPYKYDVRGTPAFVGSLKLEAVRAYYQKYYVPANMTVVVVGDVDRAGIERATRAAFQVDGPGAKPAPAVPLKLPPDERACAKADRRVRATTLKNGYLGLAYGAPSVKDGEEVYAMDLLLTLLEHEGTGRLARAFKGQVGLNATYETRRQPGLFVVTAVTGAGSLDQTEALIRKELDFVASRPVSDAELTAAKRALRGSYALDNETYSGQAATLGYYAAIDRWQFATDYPARIEAVTPDQVQAVAKKYLNQERSVAVVLKPRSAPGPDPKIGA